MIDQSNELRERYREAVRLLQEQGVVFPVRVDDRAHVHVCEDCAFVEGQVYVPRALLDTLGVRPTSRDKSPSNDQPPAPMRKE